MNKSQALTKRIEALLEDLADRVRSTKALYMRPGTPGEKDAAKSALDRMRAKHGDVHGLGTSHDHMMSHHMPNHGVTPNQHSPGKPHSASPSPKNYSNREEHKSTPSGFYAHNEKGNGHEYTGPFHSHEAAEDFAYSRNHFKPHVVHHDSTTGDWKETTGKRPKKHTIGNNAKFYKKQSDD